MRSSIGIALILVLTGCTAVQVVPLDKSHNVAHVCIEKNDRVMVGGFVETVVDVFNKHAITTEVYDGAMPQHCEYHLTYTALRSWDFAPYLSYAELHLQQGSVNIASAEYRLRNKGGLSLTKWAGVKSKMTPVVEELLSQYRLN